MDAELIPVLNAYFSTEDGTVIVAESGFYCNTLMDSIILHKVSQAELMVQAYIGRFMYRSRERLVVSLGSAIEIQKGPAHRLSPLCFKGHTNLI